VSDKTKTLLIGTSGWSYDHWQGPFYPEDLPSKDRLAFYAERFGSVEVNNSYYHLPDEKTLESWREAVPEDFRFAVKGSRYITHMKKLKDPHDALARFLERISVLGDKLGPVLFQMPPKWHVNTERLADFLGELSADFRYAFEFRDHSWLDEPVYELLREHRAAFCIYEFDGYLSPREVTADFVYVRLHGPKGPYRGSYDARSLSGWAGAFSSWLASGRRVHCYFDNDQNGYAALNAARLQAMLQDGEREE
jgi:uncharacterized protein YecE (DUF72 family)